MLVLLSAPCAQAAAPLTLQAYLDQVRQSNPDLAAARSLVEGLELAHLEAGMAFSPYLSAGATKSDTRTRALGVVDYSTFAVGPQTTITHATGWSAALSKRWFTGTTTVLEYGWQRYTLEGIGEERPWMQGGASLTVSQSLIKDVLSVNTRAAEREAFERARSAQALAEMGRRQKMMQAEAAYWGLALARETLLAHRESYARNKRLFDWMRSRDKYGLNQEADMAATEAAVVQASLAISQAETDLAEAQRLFNSLRGAEAAEVAETVELPDAPKAALPGRGQRPDVRGAQHDLLALEAQAVQVGQRYTPDLQAFATWRGDSLELDDTGRAVDQSNLFKGATSQVVGLKLEMPLDAVTWFRVRKGADLARDASGKTLEAKRLEAARDRADLEARWKGTQERLGMAARAEGLLKRRAALEKERYTRGRSSNYQVLQAEEQYTQARLALLGLKVQAQVLQAQARLWDEE